MLKSNERLDLLMKAILKFSLSCRIFFYPTEQQFSSGTINAATQGPAEAVWILCPSEGDKGRVTETLICALPRRFGACGWPRNPSHFQKMYDL